MGTLSSPVGDGSISSNHIREPDDVNSSNQNGGETSEAEDLFHFNYSFIQACCSTSGCWDECTTRCHSWLLGSNAFNSGITSGSHHECEIHAKTAEGMGMVGAFGWIGGKYIICDEKEIPLPFEKSPLLFKWRGDLPPVNPNSRLDTESCTKPWTSLYGNPLIHWSSLHFFPPPPPPPPPPPTHTHTHTQAQ